LFSQGVASKDAALLSPSLPENPGISSIDTRPIDSRDVPSAVQVLPAILNANGPDADHSSSSRPPASAGNEDLLVTPTRGQRENRDDFQWQPAIQQSAMFTGIMHGWRFATERGTRDAMRGPFFDDWMRSVGELRGWDDGDTLITSYMAHPMEGAIFGFIQQQNDPRYRAVEFGSGRAYWISRLHALAFATAMSTQWTLGPASESSLGNTNLYASPGFVDLAGTPTLGMGWMIGEDILDRYAIGWLETKTANPYLLSIVRGLGNPTRSFANMMSLRVPWHRDTRPGLWRQSHIQREEMIANGGMPPALGFADGFMQPVSKKEEDPGIYPLEAPIELMATTLYERLGQQNCYGGGAMGAARVNPHWQIVAELSGCLITGFQKYESGDSLTYLAGPRWTPRAAKRLSPYAQLLLGGRRVTHEILNDSLRTILLGSWNSGALPHYPERSAYSVENQANGFTMAAGGGFDVRLNRALALRVADLEYTHSWLPVVDQIHAADGVRFSAGLVLRIGTW
jgi:hypothetical protein